MSIEQPGSKGINAPQREAEGVTLLDAETPATEYNFPNLDAADKDMSQAISNALDNLHWVVSELKKTSDSEERTRLMTQGEKFIEVLKERELHIVNIAGKKWPEKFGPGTPKRQELDNMTRERTFEKFYEENRYK